MCGFFFSSTTKPINMQAILSASQGIARRGPDGSDAITLRSPVGKHVVLLHYLLDISGRSTRQPFSLPSYPGVYTLFNGEIYGFDEGVDSNDLTDTEVAHLSFCSSDNLRPSDPNGEYALLFYDNNKSLLRIFTDVFLTKPVFMGKGDDPGDFALASYPSALRDLGFNRIVSLEPNSEYEVHCPSGELKFLHSFPAFEFKLTQDKNTYEDWEDAFIEAVRKRANHGSRPLMMSLSSGYDSGAIALALNLVGAKYISYSVLAGEDSGIIQKRIEENAKHNNSSRVFKGLLKAEIKAISKIIKDQIEPLEYSHFDYPNKRLLLSEDNGAIGSYHVARAASEEGLSVNISGSGADEIISDYGFNGVKYSYHSEFGGLFPAKLEGFFPWAKFYGDSQRSYLMKEELIYGYLGMESRYPFLDRDVVQEFLSLSPELKNLAYKAPIYNFLRKFSYPFEEGVKRGFSIRARYSQWYRAILR
jgi:asparagine synthetase B (glutamine-hydrolysing)